jgi:peptide/nickel transport system substrate-binding protein
MLPFGHWAAADAADLARYPHDPARAIALLEAVGYHAGANGVRLQVNLKISTDEGARLLAVALQQQFRTVGIELTIRSAEFGTFYSDVTRGLFQMYILHWVGSNEDPDIFRYMYSSQSLPPKGANRGHYVNARVDELLAKAATETGSPAEVEMQRRADYVEIQKILSEDEPSVPLWFPDNVVMHSPRLQHVFSQAEGNFDFLR